MPFCSLFEHLKVKLWGAVWKKMIYSVACVFVPIYGKTINRKNCGINKHKKHMQQNKFFFPDGAPCKIRWKYVIQVDFRQKVIFSILLSTKRKW